METEVSSLGRVEAFLVIEDVSNKKDDSLLVLDAEESSFETAVSSLETVESFADEGVALLVSGVASLEGTGASLDRENLFLKREETPFEKIDSFLDEASPFFNLSSLAFFAANSLKRKEKKNIEGVKNIELIQCSMVLLA